MASGLPEQGRRIARRWRQAARRSAYRLFGRLLETDEGRRMVFDIVRPFAPPPPVTLVRSPYAAQADPPASTAARVPVFITARFRSGSTLLWHVFRQIPGATAFYEPHNPRRWFDGQRLDRRVDPTHLGVDNYWREYEGMMALGAWHRTTWGTRHLCMDASFPDPDMRAYLGYLVDHAAGRPVLQFNHVDFRLPWLMHQFPAARLLHLYRHPRDQWVSTLATPEAVPRDISTVDFRPFDRYYLVSWARDLSFQFPFLDPDREPRPYRLFYMIWRLSHALGAQHAHCSIAYERLVAEPRETIRTLLDAAAWPAVDLDPLARLVAPGRAGRWSSWAPATWFEDHEAACEAVLARELGATGAPPVRTS